MTTLLTMMMTGPMMSVMGEPPEIRRVGELEPAVLPWPPLAFTALEGRPAGTVIGTVILSSTPGIDAAEDLNGVVPTLTGGFPAWLGARVSAVDDRVVELYALATVPAAGPSGTATIEVDTGTVSTRDITWSIISCAVLDVSNLRPGAETATGLQVRHGLSNATSDGDGTLVPAEARPGLVAPDGCLRHGAIDKDGNLRAGWVTP